VITSFPGGDTQEPERAHFASRSELGLHPYPW